MESATIIAIMVLAIGSITLAVVWRQLAVQTAGTILTLVQDLGVRDARHRLFEQEKNSSISELPINKWEDNWKQDADTACQAFNAAAYLLQRDRVAKFLLRHYIRGTRGIILKTHRIARARIEQRRQEQCDLWREFDWLAKKASKYLQNDEHF